MQLNRIINTSVIIIVQPKRVIDSFKFEMGIRIDIIKIKINFLFQLKLVFFLRSRFESIAFIYANR